MLFRSQSILDIASESYDKKQLYDFESCKQSVTEIRAIRAQKNISPKEPMTLEIVSNNPVEILNPVMIKMAGLKDIVIVKFKSEGTASFMIGTTEFALQIGNLIDVKSELEKMKAELDHLEGFLKGVKAKLSNDNFVSHAPASVIENERKKQSDALQKIATIKDSMLSLEGNV